MSLFYSTKTEAELAKQQNAHKASGFEVFTSVGKQRVMELDQADKRLNLAVRGMPFVMKNNVKTSEVTVTDYKNTQEPVLTKVVIAPNNEAPTQGTSYQEFAMAPDVEAARQAVLAATQNDYDLAA